MTSSSRAVIQQQQPQDNECTSWSSVSKKQRHTRPKDDAMSSIAPLYITVGPPACGKTTWLSSHSHHHRLEGHGGEGDEGEGEKYPINVIQDISLDDQPGVFIPVKSQLFLTCLGPSHRAANHLSSTPNPGDNNHECDSSILNKSWLGRRVRDRIREDHAELMLVAQRCAGQWTKEELQVAWTAQWRNAHCDNNHRGYAGANNNKNNNMESLILRTALDSYEAVLATVAAAAVAAPTPAQDDSNKSNKDDTDNEDHHPGGDGSGANDSRVQVGGGGGAFMSLLPDETAIFVREALFQPHKPWSPHGRSALEMAEEALWTVPLNQPIAWGNTNTKATDYKVALGVAAQQKRPVFFVVYNALDDGDDDDRNQCDDPSSRNGSGRIRRTMRMETDLEAVGFSGLLQRNLRRYLNTGRYVPVRVIWDMLHRTKTLLQSVWEQRPRRQCDTSGTAALDSRSPLSKLERDQILVRLAGLEMRDNRTIVGYQNHYNQHHHPMPSQTRQRPPQQAQSPYGPPQPRDRSQSLHSQQPREQHHQQHPRHIPPPLTQRRHPQAWDRSPSFRPPPQRAATMTTTTTQMPIYDSRDPRPREWSQPGLPHRPPPWNGGSGRGRAGRSNRVTRDSHHGSS